MKSQYLQLTICTVLASLFPLQALLAQDDAESDSRGPAGTAEQPEGEKLQEPPKTTGEEAPAAAKQTPQHRSVPVHRQITQAKKLQDATKKKLNLTREQTQAIDGLFDEYMRGLKADSQNRAGRPAAAFEDNEEIKALREELKRSRESNDREAMRSARMALAEKLRARWSRASTPASELVNKIAEHLDPEQRRKFRQLAARMGVGQRPGSSGKPMQALARAVLRPNMELTREQQRAIRTIFRDGFASVMDAAGDPKRGEEITERVRAEVFNELTPKQQAKARAVLEGSEKTERDRQRGQPRRALPPRGEDAGQAKEPKQDDKDGDSGPPEDDDGD